jgi:hypothetical protein
LVKDYLRPVDYIITPKTKSPEKDLERVAKKLQIPVGFLENYVKSNNHVKFAEPKWLQ